MKTNDMTARHLKSINTFDQCIFETEPSWVVSATLCSNGFVIGHNMPTSKLKAVRGGHVSNDAEKDLWSFKLIGFHCGNTDWQDTKVDKDSSLSL